MDLFCDNNSAGVRQSRQFEQGVLAVERVRRVLDHDRVIVVGRSER